MTRLSQLSRSVAGKRVIVTGAASGMGRATAHLFADEGARVIAVDRHKQGLATVVQEITACHGAERVLGVPTDVAVHDELRELVSRTVDWSGGVDAVINNAGISIPNDTFQDEDEFELNWARTMDVNLTSHVRLVRLVIPHLVASGAGRVVNIASTEAIVTSAGISAYTASKAGVIGLTKSLAVELGRFGVTVNCICPGPIRTGMTERFDEAGKTVYAKRRVPLRRYGDPEEVAQMTLNLCLPASSYVNGVVIPVDGGMTVRHT